MFTYHQWGGRHKRTHTCMCIRDFNSLMKTIAVLMLHMCSSRPAGSRGNVVPCAAKTNGNAWSYLRTENDWQCQKFCTLGDVNSALTVKMTLDTEESCRPTFLDCVKAFGEMCLKLQLARHGKTITLCTTEITDLVQHYLCENYNRALLSLISNNWGIYTNDPTVARRS